MAGSIAHVTADDGSFRGTQDRTPDWLDRELQAVIAEDEGDDDNL